MQQSCRCEVERLATTRDVTPPELLTYQRRGMCAAQHLQERRLVHAAGTRWLLFWEPFLS